MFEQFERQTESNPLIISLSRWRADEGTGVDPERLFSRRFRVDRWRTPTLRVVVSGDPGLECRDDLLSVDGEPVALMSEEALGIESEFALGDGLVGMQPCDGQLFPLGNQDVEGPVDVEVTTLPPRADLPGPPIVERVVFRSVERTNPPPVDPPPAVVRPSTRTNVTVTMPEGTGSVWLIHGASSDVGWSAELDKSGLPTSATANGFALAWPVTVTDGLAHSIDIRWTPQRPITVTIVVCAAGFLVLLVVVLWPRRARVPQEPAAVTVPRRYIHPLVVVIVSLGVFGLTAGPIPGIVAGLTALLLEQRPHLFSRAAWVPSILLATAGVARAVWQVVEEPAPGPTWPASARAIDVLTWIAIALAVAMAMANADQRPSIRPPIQTRVLRSRR